MTLQVNGLYADMVWGEQDGREFAFDIAEDLTVMRQNVERLGTIHVDYSRLGPLSVAFDESDVTELIKALDGAEAERCRWCEQPGFERADYQPACHGHAMAFTHREDEGMAS